MVNIKQVWARVARNEALYSEAAKDMQLTADMVELNRYFKALPETLGYRVHRAILDGYEDQFLHSTKGAA